MKIYGLWYTDYAMIPDYGGIFYKSKESAIKKVKENGFTIDLGDDAYRHEEYQFRIVEIQEFELED